MPLLKNDDQLKFKKKKKKEKRRRREANNQLGKKKGNHPSLTKKNYA